MLLYIMEWVEELPGKIVNPSGSYGESHHEFVDCLYGNSLSQKSQWKKSELLSRSGVKELFFTPSQIEPGRDKELDMERF